MRDFKYLPPHGCPDTLAIARARGILACDEDMSAGIARVSSALASASDDILLADELGDALSGGRLGLSSQLFTAAGRDDRVAACTVLPVPGGDDGERVRELIASATRASVAGLGCGIDVTAFDDPAHATRAINAALVELNRRLIATGVRPPAFMITCEASHPRVREFVHVKDNADFSAWVANVSVRFDDDQKTWLALRDEIAYSAHMTGEPGVLFGEPANADNPTPQYRLESTAPCAEVFLAAGEKCVFVSINIAAHARGGGLDWELLARSVALAVRTADAAVDQAAVGSAPIVADRRRIGVGVCGFHTALIGMGVPYAAGEDLARTIAERLVFAAHAESARLAVERGPFPAWQSSRWRDPAWVARKAHRRSGAVDPAEWRALEDRLLAGGMRNAVVVAFPPTGVVSELLGVSKSYEPHFDLRRFGRELRPEVSAAAPHVNIGDDGQVPGADVDHVLTCARQLPPEVHMAIHAAFSELADEAGSKTVNLPGGAEVDDVIGLLDEVRGRGLKGLTVFRDGCLNERSVA